MNICINIMPKYYSNNQSSEEYPACLSYYLRTNSSIHEVKKALADDLHISIQCIVLYKKDYNDEFISLSDYSSIGDLNRYGGSCSVVAYIVSDSFFLSYLVL